MEKIYEVWIQDVYNNNYLIGFYHHLENSIPEINKFLEPFEEKIGTLEEYPSTFGSCFDRETEAISGKEYGECMVRGFIFDSELLGNIICDDEEKNGENI